MGRRSESLPRTAALCAALAALAILIAPPWHPPAHADGGAASARSQAAAPAPDDSGDALKEYALRILRLVTDHHANNWVRYWQAGAACHAPPPADRDADAPPRARALRALTAAMCAQLDALFGVNPAAYPPRGAAAPAGLLLNEPGAAPGYTLFSVASTKNIYLLDPLGRVAHEWHLQDKPRGKAISHANLLDNGSLLAIAMGGVAEIDPRGNVLWNYDIRPLHHDFLKMPNGNVLLLLLARKTREEVIAAGANPEFVHESGIEYDYLVEVRPAGANGGEIVWQWSPWDHLIQDFDPTKPNYGAIADHPELIDINFLLETISEHRRHRHDLMHSNSVDYNPELDQIMLSPRHFSELWIIDRSATTEEARGHSGGNSGMGGDLLYRWGNPRAYGQGDASDQRLFWQHQTHWIPPGLPGAGNILVFNNGLEFPGYERGYSSVDEIAPPADGYRYRRADDAAYPPNALAWTYTAAPPADFYAPSQSGAHRIPNGNTLIADTPAGAIYQVTPDGKIVWKYKVPRHYHISLWQDARAPARLAFGRHDERLPLPAEIRNTLYRAYWYPPDHPGLQALDLTPGAPLEDTPDLLEWARAAITAGDFGESLSDARFDIYIYENGLIYAKRHCAEEDMREPFFLHITPVRARDLPAPRRESGFANMDFNFTGDAVYALDDWCVALRKLPSYPIERIRTGQYNDADGKIWQTEINLND